MRDRHAMSRAGTLAATIFVLVLIVAAAFIVVRESKRPQSSTTQTQTSPFQSSSTTSSTTSSPSSLTSSLSSSSTRSSSRASSSSASSSSAVELANTCVTPSNVVSGITCAWLAQEAAAWKPSQNSSIGWTAYDTGASYDYEETESVSQLNAELSMLVSSGASCIRVDIGYDPWLLGNKTAQAEVTNIVNEIQSSGKCLVIGDASAEYYRQHPLDWSAYQVAWVQRVKAIAALFQPNFYAVVNEPGWYVPMVADATTNPQFTNVTVWEQLTLNLTETVLSVSPNTKVGVEIQGGSALTTNSVFYIAYLKTVSSYPGIDFIGYDVYGATDMENALTVEAQVQTTKNIWIAQTWTNAMSSVVFNSDRESLDATWIQILYYYGLKMHASNLEPFFTDLFATYTCGQTNGNGVCQGQASGYSGRTPVFYQFQHLATAYGGTVK